MELPRKPDCSPPGHPSAERRQRFLQLLRESGQPVTGAELAERLGVSRQVVVQDCALLRASGENIMATPQGYLVPDRTSAARAVFACRHSRDRTIEELTLMVDHGLKVIDVVVEHPIYGDLRGSLMMTSRADVLEFERRLANGEVALLSELTGGLHLHTVEAPSQERLERAREALREAGFLVQ